MMSDPEIPKLDGLLCTFLEGALETWERLSQEYQEGDIIDKSTAEQRRLAYMKTTNDANEGMLGAFRRSRRRRSQNETLSLLQCQDNVQDQQDWHLR